MALAYVGFFETWRTFFQEEWEKTTWVPNWVLHSRREHYINTEYTRLKQGLFTRFSMTNWDAESKMVYHVDSQGNHRYEKIVLPAYTYGKLSSPQAIERFYRLSAYNMKKNHRNDLDLYLQYKTVTLGDWLIAIYFYFNIYTRSFDPFFYKPDFSYEKEGQMSYLNLQTDNKPRTVLRAIELILLKLKSFE